jgi:predicted DNA-binding antitoxin AbrB/MazE fold protein
MSQTLTAIYSKGVLRPLVSLDLAENSEVELSLTIIEKNGDQTENISKLLVEKGLSLPKKKSSAKQSLSSKERARLAKLFSTSQPISELINQDREERF